MTADVTELLSPIAAYNLSAAQKAAQAQTTLRTIVSLWQAHGMVAPAGADGAAWAAFSTAMAAAFEAGCSPEDAARQAYPDAVVPFGLRRIDPDSAAFEDALALFFANYVTNFPLANEQESLDGFRVLLSAPPLASGYQERAYSVVCPLTGRYVLGVNFTIQPESDSVHAIYGFVMPWARQYFGFGRRLVAMIRGIAATEMARFFAAAPDRAPPAYRDPAGPLVMFEKNQTEAMTLADMLMDSAGIDAANPPLPGADLSASGVGQCIRDLAWHRLGGRVILYDYIQSSLDGVVQVPETRRGAVIEELTGRSHSAAARAVLSAALGDKEEGCTTLVLCAFVPPGTDSVPAAQIRRSNEIFQQASVVKADDIVQDIYFQAQMDSLDRHSVDGRLALAPIPTVGAPPGAFAAAEALTLRLLGLLTWADLLAHPRRTYAEWLDAKATELAA